MKYFIALFGIISITFVIILNFYPDKIKEFIYKNFNKTEYVIATPNEYYLNSNFEYISNYTDDVNNKEELLNYIYYIVNSGVEYADGSCSKEYTDCIKDLLNISNDKSFLSLINNFIHPYNSFSEIVFGYNSFGDFSLQIEHIYTKEQIVSINYVVNDFFEKEINDNMSTVDKIKKMHDYIIDNTQYDTLKSNDIKDTTYHSTNAYGVFIEGYGICSGYSDAMSIFLNKLGVNNYKISNSNHIWNLVLVNGVWLHLDTTWDDPISKVNQNRDTYFLITTDELKQLNDNTHSFKESIYKEAK